MNNAKNQEERGIVMNHEEVLKEARGILGTSEIKETVIPRIETTELESGLVMGQKDGLMCIMDPTTGDMVCPWAVKLEKFTIVDGISSCKVRLTITVTRNGEPINYYIVGRINNIGVAVSDFSVCGKKKVFTDATGLSVLELVEYAQKMIQIDIESSYSSESKHGWTLRPNQQSGIVDAAM